MRGTILATWKVECGFRGPSNCKMIQSDSIVKLKLSSFHPDKRTLGRERQAHHYETLWIANTYTSLIMAWKIWWFSVNSLSVFYYTNWKITDKNALEPLLHWIADVAVIQVFSGRVTDKAHAVPRQYWLYENSCSSILSDLCFQLSLLIKNVFYYLIWKCRETVEVPKRVWNTKNNIKDTCKIKTNLLGEVCDAPSQLVAGCAVCSGRLHNEFRWLTWCIMIKLDLLLW